MTNIVNAYERINMFLWEGFSNVAEWILDRIGGFIILFCLLLAGIIILAACNPADAGYVKVDIKVEEVEDVAPDTSMPVKVVRYIDDEAGVVCWIALETRSASISCMPMDQTSLRVVGY